MAAPGTPSRGLATTAVDSSPSVSTGGEDVVPSTSTAATSRTGTPVPQLPRLHAAAQRGDIEVVSKLLRSDSRHSPGSGGADDEADGERADPNERDAQNITALHWAAINNQLVICRILIEAGAEVDAVGGDLEATPLQWAARNGHLYIVHLLLKYNADPNLLDAQSFNTLHLAVHSSSAFLIVYILFTSQPIAVDSVDTEGHTALHWACYQGDAFSVDLLIRAGADPRKADNAGLTALHWAAVKGNASCIQRVVEAGIDVTAREAQGKTAKDMAIELKSIASYRRGLADAGFDEDGRAEIPPMRPQNAKMTILLLPTAVFFLIFSTLTILPWWSALLLSFAEIFAMHHVVTRVILNIKRPHEQDRLQRSPCLAGIITASIVWIVYVWLTRFVPHASGYAITNLLCAVSMLICTYNFFRAVTLDPGTVPGPANDVELKLTLEELVEAGMLNGMSFCLTCMQRRPLRSKHSYNTKRCVARFDHYCPWVWNDVGVDNHRQFVLFVLFLVVSIGLIIRLAIAYFTINAPELTSTERCFAPVAFCTAASFDTFALAATCWASLQLTWTIILLGAQLWQICRQMTTLEVSNVGRYGFMGGRPGISAIPQQGYVEKFRAAQAGGDPAADHDPHGSGHGHSHSHRHGHRHGGGAVVRKKASAFMRLIGMDRFTEGKAVEGLAQAGKVVNPFDLGLIRNCTDFWGRGRELGVDYTRLYDVPPGGFVPRRVREQRRNGKEREDDDRAGPSAKGKQRRAGGYERVAMEEV